MCMFFAGMLAALAPSAIIFGWIFWMHSGPEEAPARPSDAHRVVPFPRMAIKARA